MYARDDTERAPLYAACRSTPIGGGAVGVPLVTLVEGSPPQAARDFSLAIQVRAPLGRDVIFPCVRVAFVRYRNDMSAVRRRSA